MSRINSTLQQVSYWVTLTSSIEMGASITHGLTKYVTKHRSAAQQVLQVLPTIVVANLSGLALRVDVHYIPG